MFLPEHAQHFPRLHAQDIVHAPSPNPAFRITIAQNTEPLVNVFQMSVGSIDHVHGK